MTRIRTERRGPVALWTVDRPKALNALDRATLEELLQCCERLQSDTSVRCLVLTGEGRAFVAGADIAEMRGLDAERAQAFSRLGHSAMDALESLAVPTIAAVNGFALGGGCELACACDWIYAAENARFGQPEVNLGIIPGGGGTQRLPRLVGTGAAYRLLFTGDLIGAEEALRIGLVDEVVPAARLEEHVMKLAASIAEKSPVALQLIKEAVRASLRSPLDEGLRQERGLFGVAFASEDKAEGVAAFLAKRKPDFKGR